MRKLQFRAWDEENNVMVPWGKIVRILPSKDGLGITGLSDGDFIYTKIMQYIGIHDKNGKEIYEGDILQYRYSIDKASVFSGVVEYHDKVLKIGWEDDPVRFVGFILCGCKGTEEEYFSDIPTVKDIAVIGNIYENPELLGGGKHSGT